MRTNHGSIKDEKTTTPTSGRSSSNGRPSNRLADRLLRGQMSKAGGAPDRPRRDQQRGEPVQSDYDEAVFRNSSGAARDRKRDRQRMVLGQSIAKVLVETAERFRHEGPWPEG